MQNDEYKALLTKYRDLVNENHILDKRLYDIEQAYDNVKSSLSCKTEDIDKVIKLRNLIEGY